MFQRKKAPRVRIELTTGPPLRKFDWMATSSCGPNRRQILNRRYLNDLVPPVSGSTNDAPHTNNVGNATYQW